MPDEIMNRPSAHDTFVRRRAAELAEPEVTRWLNRGGARDGEDIAFTIETLAKVLDAHSSGYDIAKELDDRYGWYGIDTYLIEILDGDHARRAIEELTKQWVICCGIKPALSVGDHVIAKLWKRTGQVGTVADIRPETAQYGIRYADMEETSRYIVNFEDVTYHVGVDVGSGESVTATSECTCPQSLYYLSEVNDSTCTLSEEEHQKINA